MSLKGLTLITPIDCKLPKRTKKLFEISINKNQRHLISSIRDKLLGNQVVVISDPWNHFFCSKYTFLLLAPLYCSSAFKLQVLSSSLRFQIYYFFNPFNSRFSRRSHTSELFSKIQNTRFLQPFKINPLSPRAFSSCFTKIHTYVFFLEQKLLPGQRKIPSSYCWSNVKKFLV